MDLLYGKDRELIKPNQTFNPTYEIDRVRWCDCDVCQNLAVFMEDQNEKIKKESQWTNQKAMSSIES